MALSLLNRSSSKDVILEPFPYIIVDNVFEPSVYAKLEAEYPFEYRIDGYSGFANNSRYQISAVDGLRGSRLSPLWQEFVRYHTSKDFYTEVSDLFSVAIKKYYPNLLQNPEVGVRFKDTKADMWMDCQPGINSPVTAVSSVKGPHLDHQDELFAGLFYLRHPDDTSTGADLEIYKTTKKVLYHGARFADPRAVEKVATVAYVPNRLVLFLNTIDSIHGVSPRSVTPFTRRLVNVVDEVHHGPLFKIPMQRSFLSKGKTLVRKFLHR
jgi:hypothetical protein